TPVRCYRRARPDARAGARPRRAAALGSPGGRSLVSTYRALAELGGLPGTTAVLMDECLPVPPTTAHHSCRGFAEREIPAETVALPDPATPEAYDERIAAAGGIDVFLLASGATDGHVAMLGPTRRAPVRSGCSRSTVSIAR